MFIRRIEGPPAVTLPDGRRLTRGELQPPETRRWVASRKAIVVQAVDSGLVPVEEALRVWDLSEEELAAWRRAVARHGPAALKTTALQRYR